LLPAIRPHTWFHMIGILASVIDGVLVGSVYGLAAMGLTLIWGVMNVINLTHGAMIVLGMFALYILATVAGLPPFVTIPIVLIVGFAVGVALYWAAVHRVIGRPHLMSLLATFSVNMVLIGLGTALWSTSPYNVPVALPGLTWQGYTFTGTHITAAILALAIAGLLYLLLHRTRIGKAIRAVASNREAAELSGIPTTQVLSFAFGLGVALASVSGALIATLFPFTVLSGQAYQLKSFVVTVLGGLGNPAGALAGGVGLGVIEGLVTPFIPVSWTPMIEFVLFVCVLLLWPRGIFAFSRF
jgi:branched-chain amino acid transport system permease protein